MISVTAATATNSLGPALEGLTWTQLVPYVAFTLWLLIVACLLLVPTIRATLYASLVAIANLKQGWRLYTETLKLKGQWFARITGIALIDSHYNIVRVFYGNVDPSLIKEFRK